MDRMEVEGRLHLASESQCHVRMDVVRDGVMYFCRLLVSTSLKREKNVLIPIAS